jgi:hypothetical protein
VKKSHFESARYSPTAIVQQPVAQPLGRCGETTKVGLPSISNLAGVDHP